MFQHTFPSARCRAGVARCDITPPVGIYHRMWGAATHDRATGVHQPLTATALALAPEAGDVAPSNAVSAGNSLLSSVGDFEPCIIIAVDHCLFWGPTIDAILRRLEQETALPRSRFALTFSHTHAAGLMDPARADLPGGDLIAPYLQGVTEQLVQIVRAALAGLQPAWLTFGTGRCALATQRDFWDEQSRQFVCGFNPLEKADDTVLVARVASDAGATLATVVNYACHPTTLAWKNTLISPDYPGAMRAVVEKATNAPCVFLQGASGDLGPRDGFVGDVAVAERNGRQLGHAVLAALESLPPPGCCYLYQGPVISGATIGVWEYEKAGKEQASAWAQFHWHSVAVDLPYRPELPTPEKIKADLAAWAAKEQAAQQAGDAQAYRDAHAMVERMRRFATRVAQLPPGPTFPLPVLMGRLGDSLWVFVEGEHYSSLQQTLRERLPGRPIFVVTLTNGWRCSYLPKAEAYGKGIYQESIAVLGQGCLERLAEAVAKELSRLE